MMKTIVVAAFFVLLSRNATAHAVVTFGSGANQFDIEFVDITRHPYEEPHHVNMVVSAGNSSTQAEFEIYANASGTSEQELCSFVLKIFDK